MSIMDTKSYLLAPPVIEDIDIFCNILNRLPSAAITTVMNKLLLECSPETLHRRLVKTVPFAAHRCFQGELLKELSVVIGAILTSTVRVVNQPSFCPGKYPTIDRVLKS